MFELHNYSKQLIEENEIRTVEEMELEFFSSECKHFFQKFRFKLAKKLESNIYLNFH